MSGLFPVELPSSECNEIAMITSQRWFRCMPGDDRQQAITWTNVDQDLYRHMVKIS